MARVLLLILLGWILYVVLKRIFASNVEKSSQTNENPAEKLPEKIVQCARCGLHVPESESHISNNLITCNNTECNNIPKPD